MGKKYKYLFFLALLPALILFDLAVYMMTRASCFQCGNMSEFFKNSSLAGMVIMESMKVFKRS